MLRTTLLFATLPLVTAGAGTAAFPVSNLKDSGPGSLRQAITEAWPGGTITVDVKGTLVLTNGPLLIGHSLNIEGPGPDKFTISAGHASRVFVIQKGTVALSGMTISDGLADVQSPIIACVGGGVLNYGALTLSNVVVSDNVARGDASGGPFGRPGWAIAGGIANFGTLNVSSTHFRGNQARGGDDSSLASGGQTGVGLGGAFGNWGPATIDGSRFTVNVAQGGDRSIGTLSGMGFGGAIGNAGALIITGTTFTHNLAIGGERIGPNTGNAHSGAIGTGGEPGMTVSLAVSKSNFYHNQAIGGVGATGYGGGDAGGGGINIWNGTADIRDCDIEHNEATGGAGTSGANGGQGSGGGLGAGNSYGLGSTMTVTDSVVAHNTARGGQGKSGGLGGNGIGGGVNENVATRLVLSGVTVTGNHAVGTAGGQGIGGGVYYLGTFNSDPSTQIEGNFASTRNNNVGP